MDVSDKVSQGYLNGSYSTVIVPVVAVTVAVATVEVLVCVGATTTLVCVGTGNLEVQNDCASGRRETWEARSPTRPEHVEVACATSTRAKRPVRPVAKPVCTARIVWLVGVGEKRA